MDNFVMLLNIVWLHLSVTVKMAKHMNKSGLDLYTHYKCLLCCHIWNIVFQTQSLFESQTFFFLNHPADHRRINFDIMLAVFPLFLIQSALLKFFSSTAGEGANQMR